MVWSILAAIPLLFLLALYLLRFRYHVEYESPASLRISAGAHFLWWKKIIAIEPGRAVWGVGGESEADGNDHWEDDASAADPKAGSERGALRIPEFLATRLIRARNRARKAGTRWVLDPGVWRLLIAFLWKSGRRALWLIHPRLELLHLALQDAYTLGRLAGAWSVLSGTVPALACEVTYGFGAEEASIKARAGGRFTALGVVALLLLSVTTFPWAGLASRFADCWRDPRLTRWQRRVLLP
jgi:hypothetical protein